MHKSIRYTPVMEGVLALMAGIACSHAWGMSAFSVLALTAAALILMLLSKMRTGSRLIIPALAAAGMAGLFSAQRAMEKPDNVALLAPARGTVVGEAAAPFDYFGKGYRFSIKVREFNGAPASGKVQVNVRKGATPPLPGDTVRLENERIKPLTGLRNIGGFDFERRQREAGISARASAKNEDHLTVLAAGGWLNPWRIGEALRRRMFAFVTENFPPELAAQVSAMTVGITGGIGREERRIYSTSGLAHFFAVAGLHVGFIAGAAYFAAYAFFFHLFWLLWRRGAEGGAHRKFAALAAIAAVFMFVFASGARVSAERAGIMAAVYFAAIIAGRESNLLNALALAAFITLLNDPAALFSPSFIMSYTALTAIVLYTARGAAAGGDDEEPEQDSKITEKGIFYAALETLKLSAVITAALAPVMMAIFYEVHAGGVLANVAAIPVAAAAIPLVFPAAALAYFHPALGALPVWAASAGFWFVEKVARFFASTSLLSFTGPPPPWWLVALYYGAFALWIYRARIFPAGAAVTAAAALFFYWPSPINRNEVRFIDVGQGDATLLLFEGGRSVLVDGGPRFGNFDAGDMAVLPELYRLNIRRLDAVIATHGDMDHVGGLVAVMRRFPVLFYYDNGADERMLDELRALADKRGIPAETLVAGRELVFGSGRISVLHPSQAFLTNGEKVSVNDASLMMAVTMDGARLLLPADNGTASERYLVHEGAQLKADILKLGHHGSRGSSGAEFLDAVHPRLGVISVGRYNRYRLPARATLARLAGIPLLRTDEDGEIILRPHGASIMAESYVHPGFSVLPLPPQKPLIP